MIIGDEVKIIEEKLSALTYHIDRLGDQIRPLFKSGDY